MLEQEQGLVSDPERRKLLLEVPGNTLKGLFLLKSAEAAISAAAYSLFTPRLARADQIIDANGADEIWSTPYWFPLVKDVADERHLPQIYDSLAIFDKAYRAKYDQPSDALGWEREFAENLLKDLSQEQYNSAGFCHAIANGIIQEKKPSEVDNEVYGVSYGKIDRLAFLAIKHAADMPVDFTYTRSGIEEMLLRYLGDYQTPLVANIPDGQAGNWFRVGYQLIKKDNGSLWVKATSLSEDRDTDIVVPASAIVSVHYPDHERGLTEEHLNSKWKNPWVFKDGGILLNDLINY